MAETSDGVRAASRVLAVLQAMNRQPYSTIQSLYEATGLPKPTLVRLLKTLVADGFVSDDRRHPGYQITSLVTSLSNGFRGDPVVVEAGRAWAMGLSTKFKWPVAIAVFENDAVVVRYSTVYDSPVSPFHATINMRLSLLTRALGRAYLAGCDDERIENLMAAIARGSAPESELAQDRDAVWRMIRTVRERGYAFRSPKVEPKNSDTLAVPIYVDGVVHGSIGITYFRSAMESFGERDALIDELIDAAGKIGSEASRLYRALSS